MTCIKFTGHERQRTLELVMYALLAGYVIYVLMLGKMFSPSAGPDWYRDLGILWNDADDVVGTHTYQNGYFFPPSCYIVFHLFGLIDRPVAFRIYLAMQVGALAVAIWAWLRLIGIGRSASRSMIVLSAGLACLFYINLQLAMHNPNVEPFALVSLALVWSRWGVLSGGCYALSLAIKPYSSVFILPWMAWNGRRSWTVSACVWLILFFVVLPTAWFGPIDAIKLHYAWLAALASAGDSGFASHASLRGGLAALAGASETDLWIRTISILLQLGWLATLVVFFAPAVRRRGKPPPLVGACEAAAILLIGLPLGSHQQPARMVVLVAAALVIAAHVVDDRQSIRTRASLAVALAIVGVLPWVIPLSPLFFVMTLPTCLLMLYGLAVVRRTAVAPSQVPARSPDLAAGYAD
jgi:hypothetical protein